MTKKELRKSLKAELSKLTQEERLSKSTDLSLNLIKLLNNLNVIQKKCEVGAFAPIQMEPLWFLECEKILRSFLSYPGFENGEMKFRKDDRMNLVRSPEFGIELVAPKSDSQLVLPEVLLIPGLGFSKVGARLGRGKGHYDQYLAQHKDQQMIKIGLAFEEQIVVSIPEEAHDERMNYLVTDQKIYEIKNSDS